MESFSPDALFPLQEKSSSIPDDLGRDFNATSSYLKRHEAFENELVALEAQVMGFFFFIESTIYSDWFESRKANKSHYGILQIIDFRTLNVTEVLIWIWILLNAVKFFFLFSDIVKGSRSQT